MAVASLTAFSAGTGKCGKKMRRCVVSMTTMWCLMKFNPIMGPVNFSITTKCSAKVLSQISNLSEAVAIGGGLLFDSVLFTLGDCTNIGP